MRIEALSTSASYDRHLQQSLVGQEECRIHRSVELLPPLGRDSILLIHKTSAGNEVRPALDLAAAASVRIAIADDRPSAAEMLRLSRWPLRAYFNSYMADVHYRHMLRNLAQGQSWFAPAVLQAVIELARSAAAPQQAEAPDLAGLTPREREIALAVARGLANKVIASDYGISETTVKTHLTRIYEKLAVKDRVGLAILINKVSPQLAAPSLT